MLTRDAGESNNCSRIECTCHRKHQFLFGSLSVSALRGLLGSRIPCTTCTEGPAKFRSFPHKRAIAIALFPFRNPITNATGCLGGIAMHMCTWSGIRCPSIIWHSFCRASAWKIAPSSRRVWPKIIFRRRLDTNTTWYLQSHLEWDRVCGKIALLVGFCR